MLLSSALPVLRALTTATPPHAAAQAEVRGAAARLFPRLAERQTLWDVFDHAQIERRYLARPLDWYMQPRSFGEKNAAFVESARPLIRRAAAEALAQARVQPADVDAVVLVNTTGLSTPSLDAWLIEELGLSRHAARLPLWGLGCAGGAAGLARAADLVRAGRRAVLYVSVELCSLTLLDGDASPSNWVGTALFADGAAAAVITSADFAGVQGEAAPAPAPAPVLAYIHSAHSTLFPASADVMGWDITDAGLKVRFGQNIPDLVRSMMASNVAEALALAGWKQADLDFWALHPGGAKVLDAYAEALALPEGAFDASRAVLRDYGNMSSATVLFVLRHLLDEAERRGQPLGRGLLGAMGPGFSAEQVLLSDTPSFATPPKPAKVLR